MGKRNGEFFILDIIVYHPRLTQSEHVRKCIRCVWVRAMSGGDAGEGGKISTTRR